MRTSCKSRTTAAKRENTCKTSALIQLRMSPPRSVTCLPIARVPSTKITCQGPYLRRSGRPASPLRRGLSPVPRSDRGLSPARSVPALRPQSPQPRASPRPASPRPASPRSPGPLYALSARQASPPPARQVSPPPARGLAPAPDGGRAEGNGRLGDAVVDSSDGTNFLFITESDNLMNF